MNDIDQIRARLRAFRDARDWAQFHNPKNLACSVVIEASELLEQFQWKTPEESLAIAQTRREALSQEIADVGLYLISLSDSLGIDLIEAMKQKLEINEKKYPVAKAKGTSAKYTEL